MILKVSVNNEKLPTFLIKPRGSRQRLFFSTEPSKHHNSALVLAQSLANLSRLFFPRLTLQSWILLLLFRRLMFSTSALAFSYQSLIHCTQFPLFQYQLCFHFLPSKKAITRRSGVFFNPSSWPLSSQVIDCSLAPNFNKKSPLKSMVFFFDLW